MCNTSSWCEFDFKTSQGKCENISWYSFENKASEGKCASSYLW